MKLSDVMGAADLAVYAEVGLVLFLMVFFGVAAKVLLTKSSAYEEELNIPFDSEPKHAAAKGRVEI